MKSIDYNKLRKDLAKKVAESGIMLLVLVVDTATEDKLLQLAGEYNFNMSDYIING